MSSTDDLDPTARRAAAEALEPREAIALAGRREATPPTDRREAIALVDRREAIALVGRREAIRRVSLMLGGIAFVGGSGLLTACERTDRRAAAAAGGSVGEFTAEDIALLDEIAETILPETRTPGAKAAKTGAFMALMVTDSYDPRDRQAFRAGMRTLDDESRKEHGTEFMRATPQQRLALLERLDREQMADDEARSAARARQAGRDTAQRDTAQRDTAQRDTAQRDTAGRRAAARDTAAADTAKTGDEFLPDQRQENAPGAADVTAAPGITEDAPAHYFRMMKELALLGYFTSEIGCTQAQRYVESPGRFDPCVPYTAGETSWAPHA